MVRRQMVNELNRCLRTERFLNNFIYILMGLYCSCFSLRLLYNLTINSINKDIIIVTIKYVLTTKNACDFKLLKNIRIKIWIKLSVLVNAQAAQ